MVLLLAQYQAADMRAKGGFDMKTWIYGATALALLATSAAAQENGLNEGHLTALDADGDASVSLEEFNAFTEFAFGAIDVNKDGSLSRPEVEAHADGAAFDRTDADRNGAISAAEFKARMQANFEAADQDGDGRLN